MMQKANKIQKNPGTKKQTAKRLRKYMPLYLLSLPGFIYLIINNYLPMGGLVLAFKKYSLELERAAEFYVPVRLQMGEDHVPQHHLL